MGLVYAWKEVNEVELLLAEIAYILMGIMFLLTGQYFVVIILIGVYIFATWLQNDFKKWVFRGKNGRI